MSVTATSMPLTNGKMELLETTDPRVFVLARGCDWFAFYLELDGTLYEMENEGEGSFLKCYEPDSSFPGSIRRRNIERGERFALANDLYNQHYRNGGKR